MNYREERTMRKITKHDLKGKNQYAITVNFRVPEVHRSRGNRKQTALPDCGNVGEKFERCNSRNKEGVFHENCLSDWHTNGKADGFNCLIM